MKISLRHELNQLDNVIIKTLCLMCQHKVTVMECKRRINIDQQYSLKMVLHI